MQMRISRVSIALAGSVGLGLTLGGSVAALPLDSANLIFQEDFVGETALPTSGGVDFVPTGLGAAPLPVLDPIAGTATITRASVPVTVVSPPVDPLSESSSLSVPFAYDDVLGGARATFESFSPSYLGDALLSAGVGTEDASGFSALAVVQLLVWPLAGFFDAVLLTVVEVDTLGVSPVSPVFVDLGSVAPTIRTAILGGAAFEVELVLDPDAVPPTMQAAVRVPSVALEAATPATPTTYFASPADAVSIGAIVAAQNYSTGPLFSFGADDAVTATLVELQARSLPEPEPATMLGVGFAAVLGLARRRAARAASR